METRQHSLPTFKKEFDDLKNLAGKNSNLWDGARILLADVLIDKKQVKRILPLFMTPTREAKATLFIANYVKNCFTVPYREAAFLIHVKTPFGKGLHCPWMIVDDDSAMIYGRDYLGYPKKMGEFIFEESNSAVHASVKRRGIEIMKMDAVKGKPEEKPEPVFAQKFFNVRNPGQLYMLHTICLFRAKENITESCQAEIKLTVSESPVDPIAQLIDGSPFNGRMVVMDIIGGAYMFPVGFAGLYWFIMNHKLRYE